MIIWVSGFLRRTTVTCEQHHHKQPFTGLNLFEQFKLELVTCINFLGFQAGRLFEGAVNQINTVISPYNINNTLM